MNFLTQITVTMVTLAILTLSAGCTSDRIEEDGGAEESTAIIRVAEEKEVSETSPLQEPEIEVEQNLEQDPEIEIEPEPDWADSKMTITVGRFETRQQMLDKLQESFKLHRFIEEDVTNEGRTFTPIEQQYTVDIVVLSMKEVGIHDPVTIEEVKEEFRARGYRPLTPEEGMEMRLQLADQPSSATQHKMSAFFLLPHEETDMINGGFNRNVTYNIVCVAYKKDYKELGGITGYNNKTLKALNIDWFRTKFRISPEQQNLLWLLSGAVTVARGHEIVQFEVDYGEPKEQYPGPRFAAAVIGSEKRK